jgi:hypothetical protein
MEMTVNYKPMLWSMLQLVFLVLWYGVPSFAGLSAWLIWSPTLVIGLGLLLQVFEDEIDFALMKLQNKFDK